MKKILAIIMAVALMCTFALTVSAAETTVDDLTCGGFWTAHTKGIEVTTEGITITMTAKKAAPDTLNHNAPIWVAFSSDNQLVGGENYAEYWVQRADIYGWAGDAGNADNTTVVNIFSGTWEHYNQKLSDGTQVTIYAIRVGDTISVHMECAGMYSKVTMPVAADKPAYLSLSGEQCSLTNIKVTVGDNRTLASTLNCTAFRLEHTAGIEITEKEVVITATSTSFADNVWNGLVWLLFKGDMPIPAADTDIYWIERPDNYGWSPAGALAEAEINSNNADGMASVGVTHNGVFSDAFGSWEAFVAAQKAGVEVTITAKREGNVVTVVMSGAGLTNTVTVPVAENEPAYLSLTADVATLTNIKVTTPAPNPAEDNILKVAVWTKNGSWVTADELTAIKTGFETCLTEKNYDLSTLNIVYEEITTDGNMVADLGAAVNAAGDFDIIIGCGNNINSTAGVSILEKAKIPVGRIAANRMAAKLTDDPLAAELYAFVTSEPPVAPCEHAGGTATCKDLAVCEKCGESYGELAGHAYAEGKCTVCGAADPTYVAPCQHTNTELKDPKKATCTEAGFTGNTVCADCGETVTAGTEIAALGHTNTELKNAKSAKCEETGYTGDKVCLDCGETVEQGTVVPAVGHTYGDDDTCTLCGNPKTGDVFGIVVALMAASGTALVALKKKEN